MTFRKKRNSVKPNDLKKNKEYQKLNDLQENKKFRETKWPSGKQEIPWN